MKINNSTQKVLTITLIISLIGTSPLLLEGSPPYQNREITLIYPNGGETFYQGDTINITWITTIDGNTASDGFISILLVYDGEVMAIDCVSNTCEEGSPGKYYWTIPNPINSSNCKIRVMWVPSCDSYPYCYDESDGVFSIFNPYKIELLSPNGGESLGAGETFTITWRATFKGTETASGFVRIKFSSNGGQTWDTVECTSNTGSYDWQVPGEPSDQCLIKVEWVESCTAQEPFSTDESDGYFSISTLYYLIFHSPTQGETLEGNSEYEIEWSTYYAGNDITGLYYVRIYFSSDNGVTWSYVDCVLNTGSYQWSVPNVDSTNCALKFQLVPGCNSVSIYVSNVSPTFSIKRERDFTLNVVPNQQEVDQGEWANYTITITPVSGFNETLTITVKGLPQEATYQLVQQTQWQYKLSVKVTDTYGTFTINITAEGGGKTHSRTVTLIVNPTSQPTTTPPPSTTPPPTSTQPPTTPPPSTTPPPTSTQPPTTPPPSTTPPPTSTQPPTTPPPSTTPPPTSTQPPTTPPPSTTPPPTSTQPPTTPPPSTTPPPTSTQPPTTPPGGKLDFKIVVSPLEVNETIRGTFKVNVKVERISGSGKVSLRVKGLPSSAIWDITPQELTPPGTAVITVKLGNTPGDFNMTVIAVSGNVKRVKVVKVHVRKPSACVIATAAYGSEEAYEVQMLREFRDDIIMNSILGSSFMKAFNTYYYSFSPIVAGIIARFSTLRTLARTLITPLLAILDFAKHVYYAIPFLNSELRILAMGLLASSLFSTLYFFPLALVGIKVKKGDLKLMLKLQSGLVAAVLFLLLSEMYALLSVLTSLLVVNMMLIVQSFIWYTVGSMLQG